MAKKVEKQEEKKVLTRAQKTGATKVIVRELLAVKPMRHNELIDETAKLYVSRHSGEDTENINDVKGRVGSVLDIMKKESDIMYDGGMYALKARLPLSPAMRRAEEVAPQPVAEETPAPAPKKRGRAKKVEEKPEEVSLVKEEGKKEGKEEKSTPKQRTRAKKVEEKAPAPVAEEKPVPKKRGRKPKATVAPVEETPVQEEIVLPEGKEEPIAEVPPVVETSKAEEVKEEPVPVKVVEVVENKEEVAAETIQVEEPTPIEEETPATEKLKAEETPAPAPQKEEVKAALVVKEKAEIAPKNVVMDMSFLFGDKAAKTPAKPKKEEPVKTEREEKKAPMVATKSEKPVEKPEQKSASTQAKAAKTEEKSAPAPEKKEERKATPAPKAEPVQRAKRPAPTRSRVQEKPMTADEKLKDAFLKRMRTLGGDYFEYYSVYLLERYSMKNGRRLEGMHISGGDHDGGIDGEIELTDKFGFKETIYIQSKNWDPEKGKEENWVVGETLLQQFIGACACRQAKDGKQHTRGIFVTTSRFTPDAKKILDSMSDRIIGYDGSDLYEAAKECSFGLVQKNGEWVLDEELLSGTKAFFQML